jgi:thiol-disulfide isomerase/thioredoxin
VTLRISLLGVALVAAACSRDGATGATGAKDPIVKDAPSASAPAPGAGSAAPPGSAGSEGGKRVKIEVAPDDVDALSYVRTKRLEAKAEGRTLVVYAGAGWCPPCKQFRAELAQGRLDADLANVTLLVFDVDKDGDRLGNAGYTFQFIPYVALPGPDGKPKDSAQATGKGADAWRALLGKLGGWQRDAPR